MKQQRNHTVDSGYAWVICFSAGVWNFFQIGLVTVLGVCLPQIEEQLQISASVVGLCSGIGMGLRFNLGPIWRALSRVFSPRQLMMIGGFISCVGLIMMSFSQTVLHLAFSMVTLSLGSGIPSIARMVAMKEYFDTKFNTAVSWSYMGGTFGLLVLPLLMEYLEEMFGWRGAILIYGAINLHISVAGALVVMPNDSKKQEEKVAETLAAHTKEEMILPTSTVVIKESPTVPKKTTTQHVTAFFASFGFSVLKMHGYLSVYLITICLHDFVITGWSLFFVSYAVSCGFTLETASLFLVASGLGAVTGRLIFGPLTERVSASKLFFLFATGGGIALSCYPYSKTYWALMGNSFVAGMCIGSVTPLYMVLMKELFPDGSKDFASSVGLHYLARGIGQLLGGPVTGWIYDMSHSYQTSYSALALIEAVTACLTISKLPLRGCRKRFMGRRNSDELSLKPKRKQQCYHTNLSECNCDFTLDFKTNNNSCVVTNVNESSQLKHRVSVTKSPSHYMYVNSAYEHESENSKPLSRPLRRVSAIISPSKYLNIANEEYENGSENSKSSRHRMRKISAPSKFFTSAYKKAPENSKPSHPLRKLSAILSPRKYSAYEQYDNGLENSKLLSRPTRNVSAPSQYFNSTYTNDSENSSIITRPLRKLSAILSPRKYSGYENYENDSKKNTTLVSHPIRKASAPIQYFNSAYKNDYENGKSSSPPSRRESAIQSPIKSTYGNYENNPENSKLLSRRRRKALAPNQFFNSAYKNDVVNSRPLDHPLRRRSAIQSPIKHFNTYENYGSENNTLFSCRDRKVSAPSQYFNGARENDSENSKPLSHPLRRVSAITPPSKYVNSAYTLSENDSENSNPSRQSIRRVSATESTKKSFHSVHEICENDSDNIRPSSRPIPRVTIQPPNEHFNIAHEHDLDNSNSSRCSTETVSIFME